MFLAGSPSNALVSPIFSHVVTKLSVKMGVSYRFTFHCVGFTNLFSRCDQTVCLGRMAVDQTRQPVSGENGCFLQDHLPMSLVSPICSHVVTKLSVFAERQWTKPGKLCREKMGVSCRITFHCVGFTNLFSTLPVGLCMRLHHTEFGTALLINPKGQAERTFTVKLCFPHNSHKTKRQAVVTA